MKIKHLAYHLRIFSVPTLLTFMLGAFIAYKFGVVGLWLFTILVVLEVTFSFDNAIINSKVLVRMPALWQRLFLTLGIFIAVFVVRFLLPIFIVMVSSQFGFIEVVDLALNSPLEYESMLRVAAPIIDAFGGTFLAMIGISYFMNRNKDIHWLRRTERWLSRFGKYDNFKILIMLSVAMILFLTIDEPYKSTVLVASLFGLMLHVALELFSSYFESRRFQPTRLVGVTALASFIYLEILDASFSLDGVIGAFAVTNDIVLIMAGLGAGALWVRSFTVYLTHTGALSKYQYMEHGAHWAILMLGVMMLIKLYHIEPPEWLIGSLGLIFILTAIASSSIEKKYGERKHRWWQLNRK